MRSIGLVLPNADYIGKCDAYIGVDKGLIHLLNQKIEPLFAIGDFDSCNDDELKQIKLSNVKLKTYPKEKDDTDTALAIKEAIKLNYDNIYVFSAFNGRFDHLLANYYLMLNSNSNIIMVDHQNKCFKLKKGITHLNDEGYNYISFFPINDSFISIKGLKYEVSNYELKRFDTLCVSNEFNKNEAIIETNQDLICIYADNK